MRYKMPLIKKAPGGFFVLHLIYATKPILDLRNGGARKVKHLELLLALMKVLGRWCNSFGYMLSGMVNLGLTDGFACKKTFRPIPFGYIKKA